MKQKQHLTSASPRRLTSLSLCSQASFLEAVALNTSKASRLLLVAWIFNAIFPSLLSNRTLIPRAMSNTGSETTESRHLTKNTYA